jgi:hypothetical protein
MELVLIAFVGTLLLMAAELRDFIRRGRRHSISAEPISAPTHLGTRATTAKSASRDEEDFYDAAA